jgi:hypothetical protein
MISVHAADEEDERICLLELQIIKLKKDKEYLMKELEILKKYIAAILKMG